MKLRTTTSIDLVYLEAALRHAEQARTCAVRARAPKSHAKLHSAVKSLQGAYNHARRAYFKEHGTLP